MELLKETADGILFTIPIIALPVLIALVFYRLYKEAHLSKAENFFYLCGFITVTELVVLLLIFLVTAAIYISGVIA